LTNYFFQEKKRNKEIKQDLPKEKAEESELCGERWKNRKESSHTWSMKQLQGNPPSKGQSDRDKW
jgi:hypothetical protein